MNAPRRPTQWLATMFGGARTRAADVAAFGGEPRARAAPRAEATSDVLRFRGVLAAAVAAAAGVSGAAILLPPPTGLSSPGPLSRPHARAGLACSACHQPGEADASAAGHACIGCHGPHPSTRDGHRRLAETGALGCPTCHTIHRSDGGVAFARGEAPIRFAPGVERAAPDVGFVASHPATVPLVPVASCSGCHDTSAPRDPIARCLLAGQDDLGGERPTVCFDEHETPLPKAGARPIARGVCAGQHTTDRAVAWDGARAVAAAMPLARPPSRAGTVWSWLGIGFAAGALAFAGARGGTAIAERRKRRAHRAQTAVPKAASRVRLPQIDVTTCLGCYACVDACPYDVLAIERYVAVVARPEACCGLTLCEQRCPNGSLRVTDGELIGERPRLSDDLESLDVPGLYLAGDVSGLPLIKNAIAQGTHAATRAAASLRASPASSRPDDLLDLVIVGGGPAGISAALRAKELGLRFELLEQASVAQSIRSFPRGKLIFDQPLELPITGKLWLKDTTKEELLFHWLRLVRQERLPIRESTRVTAARRDDRLDGFVVTSVARDAEGPETTRRARRIIIAIGQRGTPRRLPFELPPEIESKVHYHLSDARSFAQKRVLVVGLGDVAMETALALCRQPETEVTLSYRGDSFRRGKSRNIDELRRALDAGRVAIRWQSEVERIATDAVVLREGGRTVTIPNDAVLVLIGSIPPWNLLRTFGIRPATDAADLPPDAPVERNPSRAP